MAMEYKDLLALMKATAKAAPSAPVNFSYEGKPQTFSYEAMNETLRKELNEYVGTYALYRENKNMLFSLIEETMDDLLPKRVLEQYVSSQTLGLSRRVLNQSLSIRLVE